MRTKSVRKFSRKNEEKSHRKSTDNLKNISAFCSIFLGEILFKLNKL